MSWNRHTTKVGLSAFLLLVSFGGYCVLAFGGAGGGIVPDHKARLAIVIHSSGGYLTSPGSPSVP